MNKPDAIDIAVRDGMEALIKSGAVKCREKRKRAICRIHGVVAHRLKDGRWSVASEENGKRKWTRRPKAPVKCPLCEAE